MNSKRPIVNGWGFLREVVFKPTWKFMTTGVIFTFLFVSTWWRDNFASEIWKSRLELIRVLPHWPPLIWLTIVLLLVLLLILQNSYGLWKRQEGELNFFRTKNAPEFVIDFKKDGDEVIGFWLRNTSSQNLYELSVVNMKTRLGEIWWEKNFFQFIEAKTGEIVLRPYSCIDSQVRFHDIPTLRDALVTTPSGSNPESVGLLEICAYDREGNFYKFSADIELWNGYTWRVWKTDRVLVKPKETT